MPKRHSRAATATPPSGSSLVSALETHLGLAAFLTPKEAAQLARVSRRTVQDWVRDRRFRSIRPVASGSGRRLIDRASFLAFLRGDAVEVQ